MHKSQKQTYDVTPFASLKGLWQRAVEFCLSVDVTADVGPCGRLLS